LLWPFFRPLLAQCWQELAGGANSRLPISTPISFSPPPESPSTCFAQLVLLTPPETERVDDSGVAGIRNQIRGVRLGRLAVDQQYQRRVVAVLTGASDSMTRRCRACPLALRQSGGHNESIGLGPVGIVFG
jgi:hypothetical protein